MHERQTYDWHYSYITMLTEKKDSITIRYIKNNIIEILIITVNVNLLTDKLNTYYVKYT